MGFGGFCCGLRPSPPGHDLPTGWARTDALLRFESDFICSPRPELKRLAAHARADPRRCEVCGPCGAPDPWAHALPGLTL